MKVDLPNTCKSVLNNTFLDTNNLLDRETSLFTVRREFIETSPINIDLSNTCNLLFIETSLNIDNLELNDTSPADIIRKLKDASPLNAVLLFINRLPFKDTLPKIETRELKVESLLVINSPFNVNPFKIVFPLTCKSLLNVKVSAPKDTFPLNDTSLLNTAFPTIFKFPLIDASLVTNNLLFIIASPFVYTRRWKVTSFVKRLVEPIISYILLNTKAVVAILFELSLTNCVGTVTVPFIFTSLPTNSL